jgi:fructose-1,6-bisphosphatase/inositol monophosphatase family enzyme
MLVKSSAASVSIALRREGVSMNVASSFAFVSRPSSSSQPVANRATGAFAAGPPSRRKACASIASRVARAPFAAASSRAWSGAESTMKYEISLAISYGVSANCPASGVPSSRR